MDRLQGMRQCRLGNGETECILCGETFRFYHTSQRPCAECGKMTCGKCGMVYKSFHPHAQNQGNDKKRQVKASTRSTGGGLSSSLSSSASVTSLLTATFSGNLLSGSGSVGSGADDAKGLIWLCKICGVQRETWKKSGAWFFKVCGSQRLSHLRIEWCKYNSI